MRNLRQHPRRLRYLLARLLSICTLAWAMVGLSGCFGPPPPPQEPLGVHRQALTVGAAVTSGCSTSVVDGLSKQLFDELNCMRPNTIADFGNLPGVTKNASHVYTWMQPAAINSLKLVLARRPGVSMNITSALRSLPQQYLLYKWYKAGRCSISLAASPGSSNHESGLALDVSPYADWRSHFQAIGWRWIGASDPVHFDYAGSGTVSLAGLSIKAFQRLWNRNNPNDKIAEDGAYGTQTEARLAQTTTTGFAQAGCNCSEGATRPCGSSDVGECKKGTETCKAGQWGACTGEVKAKAEACDGKDNDCDGKIDNGCDCQPNETRACGSDVGECNKGTQACQAGKWDTCTGEAKPATEICDGKDNDCDGKIDNGIAPGQTCQTGQPGICSDGTQACKDGKTACVPTKIPETETCGDGLDNNCNGEVDEGCNGCTEGAVQDCGNDKGECIPGKQLCENGKWGACDRQIGPTPEICDGKDNDCDGKVDQDLDGKPCDTGQTGTCQQGTQTCKDGKPTCTPPVGCSTEPGPQEPPPLPEPPPTIDAGATKDNPSNDDPIVKIGPKDPCQTSLECPTGQACIGGECVDGLRPQGCGCTTSHRPAPAFWWWLLFLLPLLFRARAKGRYS